MGRGFQAFVVEQLSELEGVHSRPMFGGFGLYRASTFFGIIHGERLFFRTDEKTRPAYVEAGMTPFRPHARLTSKNYYEVPVDVLEDAGELCRWARQAVECGAAVARGRRRRGSS